MLKLPPHVSHISSTLGTTTRLDFLEAKGMSGAEYVQRCVDSYCEDEIDTLFSGSLLIHGQRLVETLYVNIPTIEQTSVSIAPKRKGIAYAFSIDVEVALQRGDPSTLRVLADEEWGGTLRGDLDTEKSRVVGHFMTDGPVDESQAEGVVDWYREGLRAVLDSHRAWIEELREEADKSILQLLSDKIEAWKTARRVQEYLRSGRGKHS